MTSSVPHILISPNAFKNSLDASAVSKAIEKGLKLSKYNCTTVCFPIADGGDGTGSLIIDKCGGDRVAKEVHDPLGRKVQAQFGLIENGKTAVIEMADASGLRLLDKSELNPLQASSYGTGELIRYALDAGVNKVIIAMGGSATVDGGCGILSALGIKFFNTAGERLIVTPKDLAEVDQIDVSDLDERIKHTEIVVLCDVENKLLGPLGAANIFGPQKGASDDDVLVLEKFLTKMAGTARRQFGIEMDIKHGGAAGGATVGLHAFLNARLANGIDYFLTLTHFDDALQNADLLITGEGSIDKQTLQGKGPYGVAVRAKAKGIPIIGLAGKIPLDKDEELQRYFNTLISINNEAVDIAIAMANTEKNLIRTGKMIGDIMALHK